MSNKRYKLGEICRLVKGLSPTLKTEPGPYPLVVTAGFRRSAITYQLEGPAVCVPLVSSTGHGDAALHRVHYQEGKFALASLLVALLPNDPAVCDAKYLYHLLMAKKDEYLVPLMLGTANVSLKEHDIAGVEISLPPLPEQRRIVKIIDSIAQKIEQARELCFSSQNMQHMLLDSISRDIFQSIELQRFRNPLFHSDLQINALTRDPRREGPGQTFMYVDISSVGPGPIVLENANLLTAQEAPSRARRVIRKDDIIFSTVRPNLRAVAKIAPSLHNQICSTGFAVFTCGPSMDPNFLLYQVASPFFIEQCTAKTTGGHYPAINETNLRTVEIVAPELPEQRRIVAYLNDLQAKINKLKELQQQTAAEIDALLPSILDKAFKGNL